MLRKPSPHLVPLWSILLVVCFALVPNQVFATAHHTLGQHAHLVSQVDNVQATSCVNNTGDDCPPWWSNTPCDSINHKNATGIDSAILFDPTTGQKAIYNGIEACGPLPRIIGISHDYNVSFYPGGPSEGEWECTELVKRYLYQVFHLPNLKSTNGSQVVSAYSSAYPTVLKAITNGTQGVFPQPGDVLSYGDPNKTAGHTSIVTGLTITDKVNGWGSITIIDQNGSSTGMATHQIKKWVVNGNNDGGKITSWLTPRTWSITSQVPNPYPNETRLNAVSAISDSDVWAVGGYTYYGTVISLHWDGKQWTNIAVPTGTSYLSGVSASASAGVWAVGFSSIGYNLDAPLTLYWVNNQWQPVQTQNPGGVSHFYAVSAISSTDVWAVGEQNLSGVQQTLIEHCNLTACIIIPSPNQGIGDNVLTAISATSSTDVWAVGYYILGGQGEPLTLHWDGSQWMYFQSPGGSVTGNTILNGVAAISSNDVWAVGYYDGGSISAPQTYTLHWDGSSWSSWSSPNKVANTNILNGISARTSNDIRAVGYYIDPTTGADLTLILRWDGYYWTIMSSPNLGQANYLNGVAMTSTGAWAVGYTANPGSLQENPLVERLS